MRKLTLALSAALTAGALLGTAAPASAQGCILLRQTSPMFGTAGSTNQEVGTWDITFTARNSTADRHWNGSVEQVQRRTEQTYVVNRQNSMTMTLSYQATPRLSLNVGVPFVEASWGIPSPRSGGPATRANENARGIGDITSLVRFSLVDPAAARTWNIQVGGGLKVPTGENASVDTFPDGNGNNNQPRYTDISVNPGDGGWGIIMDFQGYKAMGRFLPFGSATWMMNPRNTGGPTRGTLVSATPTNYNTVSDQFVFRSGTAVTVTHLVTASVAWRMEGVPRYDLIGRSDGFRRPGVEMYVEPGVTVTAGRQTLSFNMPIGYYRNRFRNPYTGNPGDSTFPAVVAIATYSARLGKAANMTHGITDQPPPSQVPGLPQTKVDDQDSTGQQAASEQKADPQQNAQNQR